ncbi:MAG: hypothetical protein S4CHLAM81_11270 [Chlamydiales bacterium]|nr:hypothetical protein [Chlamydiales bacterium]MCH9635905.1 hypothetical protein [Chlamydiales bacterium]
MDKTNRILNIFIVLLTLFLPAGCMKSHPRSAISLAREEICSKFIEVMQEKCPELTPIGTGGGVAGGKITRLQIAFQIDSLLTIEESRRLMLQLVKDLENIILTTPEFLAWFENKEAVLGTLYLSIHGGCPNQDEMNKRIMSW